MQAVPTAHFTIIGSESDRCCRSSNGIQHAALVVVSTHIQSIVLFYFYCCACANGEFRRAAINLNVAKQSIAIGIIVPGLVGANLSSSHSDISVVVAKRDIVRLENEGTVGRAGINTI